jgi:hypothetical protein
MIETLTALAVALATALGFPHPSPRILSAAVAAVAADSRPLEGSADLELAVMMVYAVAESRLEESPKPWLRGGVPVDSLGVGPWQEHVGQGTPLEQQATYWVHLVHEGEAICPAHPLAPLSGGCGRAWRLSDRRVAEARDLLSRVAP